MRFLCKKQNSLLPYNWNDARKITAFIPKISWEIGLSITYNSVVITVLL